MKIWLTFIFALFATASAHAADPVPYGRLPAIEDMRLSPSGERFAFLGTIGAKRVFVVLGKDPKPLYLSAIGEVKVRNIRWAGDDHLLILITKTEDLRTQFGNTFELASVFRVTLKDQKLTRIFEGVPSVAQRIFGMYGTARADGKDYGYFGGITLQEATGQRAAYVMGSGQVDLYRVDLDSGKATIAAKGQRDRTSRWLMSPDGKVAATALYNTAEGVWVLHAGTATGPEVMQRKTPLDSVHIAGFGRTPGTFLVIDQSGESDQALEVKPDGSSERLFMNAAVAEFLFDPGSGLLIGARLNDPPNAMFFDPKLDERWKSLRKTFPGMNVTLVSVSRGLDHMIIKSDGGRDAGTYWLLDPATGATKPLGRAYPTIAPEQVGPTQLIRYAAEDGLEIEAVLTLPPQGSGKDLPLVVMPHGGPIGISDHIGFDWWAQAFAANGYAVLQPNYRGSSGYSAKFRDAGYGEWGKKMLSDIKDGIGALTAKGIADPKRVCIVGGSYGGYAAMAGVTVQQGLYRCAVAVSGISDMPRFFSWLNERSGQNAELLRFERAVTGTVGRGDGAALDAISPVHFAKRADAPILLIHGKDDTVVPIAQSAELADALESAGKPVELIRMDSEDHWLSREETRVTMIQAAVAFVQKHNPAN